MKTIVLDHAAAKQLDALPFDAREAIVGGLNAYAMSGRGDVKSLQGRQGRRLRVGQYRVLFVEDADEMQVVYIGRRTTTTYR